MTTLSDPKADFATAWQQ